MLWRSHLQNPPSNPNQNGAKVGVFLGKLDVSDEVIVGAPKGIETTRLFRRMTEDRQWNPQTLRMFVGVPWNPCGVSTDAPGRIRKRYMEEQTDVLPVKVWTSMCQGVGNGLRTSLTKGNSQVNHVRWYNKTGQFMLLNKSYQVISACKWSESHNNNMHQSQSPVHSHPIRVTKSQCKSARHRAVQEIPMTRMTREQFVHAWT